MPLPELFLVRQRVDGPVVADVGDEVRRAWNQLDLGSRVQPGASVAIAVGSRGIANLADTVTATVAALRDVGLDPFIVPAMGSHGGATAEGQAGVLAALGITAARCGCPVRAQMDVVELDRSPLGYPVVADRLAAEADHLVLINRVKPHTQFDGPVQSGLAKMLLLGLGKHAGAVTYHRAFVDHGFSTVIADAVPRVLAHLPVLAGLALVERADDRTSMVRALPPERFLTDEPELLTAATRLLPRLPFAEADLLLIDEMGKDISGTGFDTNVVGRKPSLHHADAGAATRVHFIAVRALTERSNGNGIGVGLAELARRQVVDAIDLATTRLNALTAGDLPAAMLPIDLETDREIVEAALGMIGLREPEDARIVWIRNTLRTDEAACSAAYLDQARERDDLEIVGPPFPLPFDETGNLPSLVADLFP